MSQNTPDDSADKPQLASRRAALTGLQTMVRPATVADEAAVTQVLRRSYSGLLGTHYPAHVLKTVLPFLTVAQPELLRCGTYFVAEDAHNGVIVGAGGWTDASPTGGIGAAHIGHMRHVAVDPAYAGRGVGRGLLTANFASARDSGLERLKCMSTLNAKRFYQAMGFHALAEVEVSLARGVYLEAVEMACELTAPK